MTNNNTSTLKPGPVLVFFNFWGCWRPNRNYRLVFILLYFNINLKLSTIQAKWICKIMYKTVCSMHGTIGRHTIFNIQSACICWIETVPGCFLDETYNKERNPKSIAISCNVCYTGSVASRVNCSSGSGSSKRQQPWTSGPSDAEVAGSRNPTCKSHQIQLNDFQDTSQSVTCDIVLESFGVTYYNYTWTGLAVTTTGREKASLLFDKHIHLRNVIQHKASHT